MRMLVAIAVLFVGTSIDAVAAEPVAGRDYIVIPDGKPYEPLRKTVEVVEIFGYTCIHCANFQPLLSAWHKRQPGWVRLKPLTLDFNENWEPYARAYFAATDIGIIERTHDDMFRAVHVANSLPLRNASSAELSKWYGRYGIDPGIFSKAMDSLSVSTQMDRANAFTIASGVDGTPTMIINGRYRVPPREFGEMLRIVDFLVAREGKLRLQYTPDK